MAIVLESRPLVSRLICDPRWDPNAPYSEQSGWLSPDKLREATGTILHLAVEKIDPGNLDVCVDIVADIIASGADVHRLDETGRTPLLLCEMEDIFSKLVQCGADTRDRDRMNRNVYHLAAATNDADALQFLLGLDRHKSESIQQRDSRQLTPLALAIRSVKAFGQGPKTQTRPTPEMALSLCIAVDDLGMEVDIGFPPSMGILGRAVEWGHLPLVKYLLERGCNPIQMDGRGCLLHHVNFGADPKLVRLIADTEFGNVPKLRQSDGYTPLETVFHNTVFLGTSIVDTAKSHSLSDHPSCHSELTRELFMALLDTNVCPPEWRNPGDGKSLWERFMVDIVPTWAFSPTPLMRNSVIVAVKCLTERGYLASFEKTTGRSALVVLLDNIPGHFLNIGNMSQVLRLLQIMAPETQHFHQYIESDACIRVADLGTQAGIIDQLDSLYSSLGNLDIR